jgi:hypothetical protein
MTVLTITEPFRNLVKSHAGFQARCGARFWAGRGRVGGYVQPMSNDPQKRSSAAPGHGLMRELGGMVLDQLRDALTTRTHGGHHIRDSGADEPPVVAQLMIEIRADGSRTIARGALSDLRTGESATVRAEGRTPSELMLALASSLLTLPSGMLKNLRRGSPPAPEAIPETGSKTR